jgi:hypothetical protein
LAELLLIELAVGDVANIGEKMHRLVFLVRNHRTVDVNPDDASILADVTLLQIE